MTELGSSRILGTTAIRGKLNIEYITHKMCCNNINTNTDGYEAYKILILKLAILMFGKISTSKVM